MHRKLARRTLTLLALALVGCAPSPPAEQTREAPAKLAQVSSAPPSEDAVRVAEHLARGGALWKERRHKEALAAFQAAERINPDDVRVLYAIGTAHRHNGDYREALRYFDRLLQLAPNDPRNFAVHGQIGSIHRSTGDNAAAIAALQSALKIKPDDWRVLAMLGDVYFKTKQYEQSKAHIERFKRTLDAQNLAMLTEQERQEVGHARQQLDIFLRLINEGRVER